MAQTQTFETAQAQTPQQFTPEEATQILTDAVNLSSQYLTLEQLETIADEAGVPRETLYQAIQRRTQRLDALKLTQLKKQERRQRWKTRLKRLLLWTGLLTLLGATYLTGVEQGRGVSTQPRPSYENTLPYWLSSVTSHYLEELMPYLDELAVQKLQGKGVTYYVMPYAESLKQSGYFTSIWQASTKDRLGQLVFKTHGQITRASLSEDGKLLAMYIAGGDEGGVWVLDLKSGERHRVLGEWGNAGGYALPVQGKLNEYVQAYGGEVTWVGKRKLLFSTTDGRYTCEVNERGAPLRYERFDNEATGGE